MTAQLPSLSFCMIGETAIFLDLVSDRYFRLAPEQNASFASQLAGSVAGHDALVAAGLGAFADASPITMPSLPPTQWHRPDVVARPNPFRLLEAAICQRQMERRLKSAGLAAVLQVLHRQLRAPLLVPVTNQVRAMQIVGVFEQTKLFRSAVDRCLPCSLALAQMLARAGYRAQVIVGVKLQPFAAHCWVQSGGIILNESPEEAARYTPILIL